jgi:hypothetical protein
MEAEWHIYDTDYQKPLCAVTARLYSTYGSFGVEGQHRVQRGLKLDIGGENPITIER